MRSSISHLLWSPVRILLWLTSKLFGWYFLTVPRFVRRWVPHSSNSLSIAFLYIFAQALALMWLLVVNLCSVCSVLVVQNIQYYLSEDLDIVVAFKTLLTGYVRYCILRCLFFIGTSFYVIGWEAFADFPIVRRLVAGRRPAMAMHTNGSSQPHSPHWRRTKSRSSGEMEMDGCGSPTSPVLGDNAVASWLHKESQEGRDTSEDDKNSPQPEDSRGSLTMMRMVSEDSEHSDENPQPDVDKQLNKSSIQRRKKRKRFFREATLLAPLFGLIACSVAMIVLSVACQVERIRADVCDKSLLLGSMADPTGRVNRGIRFALFVAFLQWVQQFFYLFPHWYRGLQVDAFGKAWSLVSVPLWPAVLGRFCQWSFVPAGTGVTHNLLLGPHHAFDMVVMTVLQVWWSGACVLVLKRPEMSGLDRKRWYFEEEDWSEMAGLFKYSFLIPTMLHFLRGCVKFGFADAQNDLLVIVCAYPLLLVTVWTIVWAVVVAPGKRLLLAGAVGSLSLASSICSAADSAQAGATVVVWLHLMRQYLKLFKRRDPKKTLPRQRTSSGSNLEGVSNRSTSNGESLNRSRVTSWESREGDPKLPKKDLPTERRLAWCIFVLSALIAVTFFGILASLTAVSGFQQKIDWYPSTIWFEREEDPPTLRVDHTISRLRLQLADTKSETRTTAHVKNQSLAAQRKAGVSYGVCSHAWHGLSVLDYALLSLASYFDQSDPSLSHLLDGIFPGESGIRWQLTNFTSSCRGPATYSTNCTRSGSRLSWIEVEIDDPQMDLPILVLALRGTDPFRISDYVEDIRMWTEPVALSILSTVFPTVRAWPRKTVEMIILGIHDFLFSLGLPSDTWSYSELVECISRIPRDRYSQVVLTGHSLGGGMATVVAALTHLPVVGITPPGIYWSLAKHQRANQASRGAESDGMGDDMSSWMHHQSLTLLVENDWVNGIFDDHGGLVQMMTCDRSKESLELACHMLEGTICHIFDRCGDPRNRFDSCVHEYVLKDTLQSKTVEVLREVMPSRVENVFFHFWELLNQPLPIGSRMFGNTVVLLLFFFVAMPLLGGILDKGFLL